MQVIIQDANNKIESLLSELNDIRSLNNVQHIEYDTLQQKHNALQNTYNALYIEHNNNNTQYNITLTTQQEQNSYMKRSTAAQRRKVSIV